MDSYNHNNANKKRKFSTSKEREEDVNRQNKKSIGCFGRCCTRRKHDITAIKTKENRLQTSVGKIPLGNDNINQESVSNVPMIRLTRSPLYNQSRFCQNALQEYYDPCIECVVQDGPDIWENIPKNFQNPSRQLYDNNKSISIERLDTFLDKKISNNDLGNCFSKETSNPFKNNVNSFINDVIGDGVDRISEIITTMSTDHNIQKQQRIDNKLSTNSGKNLQENELKRKLSDSEKTDQNVGFIKQQQTQHPGLVFKKQNLKTISQISHYQSVELSLDNASSAANFDQKKALQKENSSQDQEPYNWDYQEYQWPSSLDLSQKNHLIDTSMNDQSQQTVLNDKDPLLSDDDNTDLSYSIASVLPSNKKQKATSPNESKDLNHTNSNQQQKSFSNVSEEKTLLPTRNSIHSTKISSGIDAKNNVFVTFTPTDESFSENILHPYEQQPSFDDTKRPTSSELLHHQDIPEQNDRFSATSVSDLFKQIIHTKLQKSLDLESISTAYSIPVSIRPSVLPEIAIDKHNQTHTQSSRTTLTEKDRPFSSNTETKRLKSITSIDAMDQTQTTNIRFPIKHILPHPTDNQKKQSSNTKINNPINQVHSTYDDIMNSWRHLLERLLTFMLPSTNNTDQNINLSPSTIPSNTHSWSTLTPSETLNMIPSDNIGPWWGRRDPYDRTPATFIFANEPLNSWYSLDMITNNKQNHTSIGNRPCYSKYYSCPNTCHCCCNSLSS